MRKRCHNGFEVSYRGFVWITYWQFSWENTCSVDCILKMGDYLLNYYYLAVQSYFISSLLQYMFGWISAFYPHCPRLSSKTDTFWYCFVGFRLNPRSLWRRYWVKRSSLWWMRKCPLWNCVFMPSLDWHLICNQALATAIPWLPRQQAYRHSPLRSR